MSSPPEHFQITPTVVITAPTDVTPPTADNSDTYSDYQSNSDTFNRTATAISTGWIIGIVLVSLAFIVAVVAASFLYRRHKRKRQERMGQNIELHTRDVPPRYENL
ncbi:hypothetical protein F4804DRAFT_314948 [Jackrogersella minutella]|nr:hypothetical protein F4804DRAFT_314948 [Jackrogersella minutella]